MSKFGRTRKNRKRVVRKKIQQKGGSQVDIRKKPIVVIFFHGGCSIDEVCYDMRGKYTLEKNNQLMVISHPGEIFNTNANLREILSDNTYRFTTFEPFFDIHSISDLNTHNAYYYKIDILNPVFSNDKISPFTNKGKSLFESSIRIKEGSKVPNSVFTFENRVKVSTLFPKFGLYIYYPDKSRPVRYIDPSLINNKVSYFHLSDIFDFLKRGKLYNPEVGIGVIQLSCNTFYKDYKPSKVFIESGNLDKSETLLRNCYIIEEIYQQANAEYYELDLLDGYQISEKYGKVKVPIVSSRKGKRESDELLEMMKKV